ncbi:tetratricopeptide repeat protein [Nitrosococcus wardiae]|uniref:Tetratricopeptide repeat protein n=1 Tax=Nitrosococcus wardiae TaxID=1814290 RepID=A0A4V1AW98_9GAMM|nr:tetratricopeptide repeat protein [Nitrosococcus wardiae]
MDSLDSQPYPQGMRLLVQIMLLALSTSLLGCATATKPPPENRDAAAPDPQAVQKAIETGDQAFKAGNRDLALFHYVKVLTLDQENINALYKIATIHREKRNTELAEKAYRDTLKQKANHAGALEGFGLLQLHKKEFELAKDKFAAAVKIDPKRWRAHNGLGVIADLRKDYVTAQQHYQAALEIKPGLPLLLNNLGYSHYLAGDWELARSFFEKILAKDSRYEKAWANLGLIYVRQGHHDKATGAFQNIMDEPESLYHIGYILMMEGEHRTAEKYFRKAIHASPTYYPEANDNLEKIQALLKANG